MLVLRVSLPLLSGFVVEALPVGGLFGWLRVILPPGGLEPCGGPPGPVRLTPIPFWLLVAGGADALALAALALDVAPSFCDVPDLF